MLEHVQSYWHFLHLDGDKLSMTRLFNVVTGQAPHHAEL
jgi:hypothetical protein